jgi:IS30 family transposase
MNMSKAGKSQTDIAQALGVSVATVSREMRRNLSIYGYIAIVAELMARIRRCLVKRRFKITPSVLDIIKEYLKKKWSPECIANTVLKGKICCQTIYNYIRNNPELAKLLFFKRRYRKRGAVSSRGLIPNRISIEERPKLVDKRVRYGDFEGDLIVGKNHKGSMLTLVERKSRYVLAVKLESKNAEETGAAIVSELDGINAKTLTLDNGKEFANHERVNEALGVDVYFAHPYCPHERGLSENTNRLLRRYFPKKTDLRKVSENEVSFAVSELNSRPRKCLNWKTPNDFLRHLIPTSAPAPMGA